MPTLPPLGSRISGTFSQLPFAGEVVAHDGAAIAVRVDSPAARGLPVSGGVLSVQPGAVNITIHAPHVGLLRR
jgi:hypothetical protein